MYGIAAGYEDDGDEDDFDDLVLQQVNIQETEEYSYPKKNTLDNNISGPELSKTSETNINSNHSLFGFAKHVQPFSDNIVKKSKKKKKVKENKTPNFPMMATTIEKCFDKVILLFQSNKTNQRELLQELSQCWDQCTQPFHTCLNVLIHTSSLKHGVKSRFHNLLMRSLDDHKQRNTKLFSPSNNLKKNVFTFLLTSNNSNNQSFSSIVHTFELTFVPNGRPMESNPGGHEAAVAAQQMDEKLVGKGSIVNVAVEKELMKGEEDLTDEKLKDYIIESLKQLITLKNYLKTSRFITTMQLHADFPCNEICIGLLLQGHSPDVEKFLQGRPADQDQFICFVDQLLSHMPQSLEQLIKDLEIPGMKKEMATEKAITKQAVKLIRLFNIAESNCPYIVDAQIKKAIKYLVVKKFILKELGCDEWEDLVSASIEDNQSLQLFLINSLIDVYELNMAARMAVKYHLPSHLLPPNISDHVQQLSHEQVKQACNEVVYRNSRIYHDLRLDPERDIVWVDALEGFRKCIGVLSSQKVVGFDTEWRPSFTSICNKSIVSVIQLAADDKVFVLDMLKLSQLPDIEWQHFFEETFFNGHTTVLAYGVNEDLMMMAKTLPSLQRVLSRIEVFDLEKIHAKLVEDTVTESVNAFMVGLPNYDRFRGLSDLVRRCFGVPLDKSQQISDWLKRPLRQKQLVYAALDAHCLIEIYDHLLAKYPHLLNYQQKNIRNMYKKKWQESLSDKTKSFKNQLSFVCDNMLIGLGASLRKCGIDVITLESTDPHEKALQVAKDQHRIILSSGSPCQKMSKEMVGHSAIYCVTSLHREQQLMEVIKHFNVKVDPADVFKRCQVCNYDEYLVLSNVEMKLLWAVKRALMGKEVPERYKFLKVNNQGQVLDHYRKDYVLETEADLESQDEDDDEEEATAKKKWPEMKKEKEGKEEKKNVKGFRDVNISTATIKATSVSIHCENLKMNRLEEVDKFCVCCGCGKVYWVGLHHRTTHDKLQQVFNANR